MARFYKYEKMSIEDLAVRDGLLCGICGENLVLEYQDYMLWKKVGRKLFKRRKYININIDHIIPRSKGGTWDPKNLQLVHKVCNDIKGNKIN